MAQSTAVSQALNVAGLAGHRGHAGELTGQTKPFQARATMLRDSRRASYSERVLSGLECCSSGSENEDLRIFFRTSVRTEPARVQIPRPSKGRKQKVLRNGRQSVNATLAEEQGLGLPSKEVGQAAGVNQLEPDQQGNPAGLTGLRQSQPRRVGDSAAYAMEIGSGAVVATQVGGQILAGESSCQPKYLWFAKSKEEERLLLDQTINGGIVTFAAAAALAKIFTVDHEYWTGWTIFEIIRVAPHHNWLAYEAMLESNPVLAKMIISGVVYTVGDWIAQCYEGRKLLAFDRARMVRSGLVGFCLHGSLSHHYYHFCEWLFPFQGWWAVAVKVAFDQTIWSGVWNSIYYVTLGMLRFENPTTIWRELKATFFPLLTAGWKLWPLAHIVTYGVVPVEQRLLWVDMVELVWVTILSMISNEKAEGRKTEGSEVVSVQEAGREAPGGEAMLSDREEAAVNSILWSADMKGQEYIIEDSHGLRRLEKHAESDKQA